MAYPDIEQARGYHAALKGVFAFHRTDWAERLDVLRDVEDLCRQAAGALDDAQCREEMGIVADYGLLEAFTMQATLDKGGAPLQITGMHRVAEKNLENLNAAQLKNLLRKGLLARIYVHLMSLDNFRHLLERKSARESGRA